MRRTQGFLDRGNGTIDRVEVRDIEAEIRGAASPSTSQTAIRPPSAARRREIALPMDPPAPVTMAVFPASRCIRPLLVARIYVNILT
jgi:hypothetical protein